MEILKAIVLGVVEGLTEFLPISSTGHLIVAEDLIGYHDASKLFTIVIQLGAIAAVIWFYRSDMMRLLKGLLRGDEGVRRFWLIWILATIPAAVVGLLFEEGIEKYATVTTVAWSLIIGGVVIWLVENYHKTPKPKKDGLNKITAKQAVQVGLYQVLALVPGASRSGATIIGAMLSGLDRVTATAFSFYLGIPILVLAGIYKMSTDDVSEITGGSAALLAGTIASFITALVVVGWLLKYVSKHNLKAFGYYRIIFGALLLLLIGLGTLG